MRSFCWILPAILVACGKPDAKPGGSTDTSTPDVPVDPDDTDDTDDPDDSDDTDDTDDTDDCTTIFYRDADLDGQGKGRTEAPESCEEEDGVSTNRDDCDDSNPEVYLGAPEQCGDIDYDCDRKIGCDDTDCASPACAEHCTNGWDDDADGLIDCEDSDCAEVHPCIEDCTTGADDDGDGLVNCEDDDCWGEPECRTVTARVTGGRYRYSLIQSDEVRRTTTGYSWRSSPGASWRISGINTQSTYNSLWAPAFSVTQLTGTAISSNGSGLRSCQWGFDAVDFPTRAGTYVFAWLSAVGSGFWSSGGCGLSAGQFLPQYGDFRVNQNGVVWSGVDWIIHSRTDSFHTSTGTHWTTTSTGAHTASALFRTYWKREYRFQESSSWQVGHVTGSSWDVAVE